MGNKIVESELDGCVNCKSGERCNKYINYIHCNIYNASFTKTSKCKKWERKDDKEKV